MYVVDANVWVSRFQPDDPHHHESVTWLRLARAERADLVEPAILLPEFAGSIARRTLDEKDALGILERMRAISRVRLHQVDISLCVVAAQLAASLRLKGADAVYAALAMTLGFRLVTWDRELRDRARPVVAADTPADLLRTSGQ